MYNSHILINEDGFLVANTEYKGLVAFYLKKNHVWEEKKWYEFNKQYVFKNKPSSGVFSVRFFFKDNEGVITIYDTDNYAYSSENKLLFNINNEGTVLKEAEDYKITYYNRDSTITFITFNGTKTTKKDVPFGFNLAMSNGWNLISVAQDNDTQYQGLSLEDFYEAVSPVIVNKDVYAYGASLGGYCALYFGGCINATIIAGAPKNSAHSSINLDRFQNLNFSHGEFSTIPTTTKPVYIVYDSTLKSDSMFIENCISLAYPSANFLTIENGTHIILQTMLNAGVLKLYIDSIVNREYSDDISYYVKAKCKFFQGKDKEAFTILEGVVKKKLYLR